MTSSEMPGIRRYYLRYVHGACTYELSCWGLPLSCYRCWYSINRFFQMYLSFPRIICVSVLIHLVFFILSTYALWNKNRILLVVMLSIFFVSSQSIHHTQASGRCINQTFIGASVSISFATVAPETSTFSHLPPWHSMTTETFTYTDTTSAILGITGCYRTSTSFPLFIPILLLSVFELIV
jgi:hypothetical protein